MSQSSLLYIEYWYNILKYFLCTKGTNEDESISETDQFYLQTKKNNFYKGKIYIK